MVFSSHETSQVTFTDPTLSVVVRHLLQFSSDFDQTWYVSSLRQGASELCSDKKFDPWGPQEGHLKG